MRIGAESRPETHLRLLLVTSGLPEPLLNDPTSLLDGEVLHPDLKYVQWRIVEVTSDDLHVDSSSLPARIRELIATA
ncbi:hypothetical protein [Agromyces bauzanensis]|uniref:Uncharacterized protein n=1 Tax=Agromyces bauzanensis TaxID=1308924 RepID=A0A917P8G6_9MICO|nr:hypothetical protein [Agromyces bauzanensis]GGJ66735.1 hypothetical protein GCM10011372_00520 [Agromyces bauzanensis]